MINVKGKYQIKKIPYNWVLSEAVEGKDKDGIPKTQYKDSYHATMKQACLAIIDKELGHCDSIEEVLALLIGAENILVEKVEGKLKC